MCIVAKVKRRWEEAGIKSVQDFIIRKKILELSDEFIGIKKRRRRTTPGSLEEREAFKGKLSLCFSAAADDVRDDIMKDKMRKPKDKEEDLKFLEDQFDKRVMFTSEKDTKYAQKMKAKMKRAQQARNRQKTHSQTGSCGLVQFDASSSSSSVTSELETPANNTPDGPGALPDDYENECVNPDGETKGQKRKREDTIPAQIPLDIVRRTAGVAERHGISICSSHSTRRFIHQCL